MCASRHAVNSVSGQFQGLYFFGASVTHGGALDSAFTVENSDSPPVLSAPEQVPYQVGLGCDLLVKAFERAVFVEEHPRHVLGVNEVVCDAEATRPQRSPDRRTGKQQCGLV